MKMSRTRHKVQTKRQLVIPGGVFGHVPNVTMQPSKIIVLLISRDRTYIPSHRGHILSEHPPA